VAFLCQEWVLAAARVIQVWFKEVALVWAAVLSNASPLKTFTLNAMDSMLRFLVAASQSAIGTLLHLMENLLNQWIQ
jgi:hypothetical protein